MPCLGRPVYDVVAITDPGKHAVSAGTLISRHHRPFLTIQLVLEPSSIGLKTSVMSEVGKVEAVRRGNQSSAWWRLNVYVEDHWLSLRSLVQLQ